MVSYCYVKYQKKLMIQSWENLVTDGRTDRRTRVISVITLSDRRPASNNVLWNKKTKLSPQLQNLINLIKTIIKRPKNHFVPSIHSWDPANFRVLPTKRLCSFMTTPTQKSLNQLLIFMNLHQHAKIQAISSILFRNIVDLTNVG